VSSLTGPLALRTLETVATDIFASRATSLIVTMILAMGSARAVDDGRGREPEGCGLLADLYQERFNM
jgi:hypothetical protein